MAKKLRLEIELSKTQKRNLIETFELQPILDKHMQDDRIKNVFDDIKSYHALTPPVRRENVSRNSKTKFWKNFDHFKQQFYEYYEARLCEYALETFFSTLNIKKTIMALTKNADDFFSQTLALAFEQIYFELTAEKINNGYRVTDWL